MIKRCFLRWRLRWAVQREELSKVYRLLVQLGNFHRYRPAQGIRCHREWAFSNVGAFYLYLSDAVEVVRMGRYTDRLRRTGEGVGKSLDDYLTLDDGSIVQPTVTVQALYELYQILNEELAKQDTEKRRYYERHFAHIKTEFFTLLLTFK